MRILVVNKFLYPRGGDCIAAMMTQQILKHHGHSVRGYAMSYPLNIETLDNNNYASEVSFNGSLAQKFTAAKRMLGYGDIRDSVNHILDDFKPEIVHLHNIHSYLSPIIGEMAHKRGIKVIWTLHDYKLLCPAYSCRQPSGATCRECFNGNLQVIRHRCMKGSLIASLLAHIEAKIWSHKRLEVFTDQFIAPSQFMFDKMVEGGFNPDKISVLSNAIAPERAELISNQNINSQREDYFCYVGRLSEEKGVETLLLAASRIGAPINIAGDGPLKEELIQKYKSYPNIKFLGQLNSNQVIKLLSRAKASIISSECYENNPIGVIESLCCGTPVIGANIGGIPELISPSNGVIYTSGNANALASAMTTFDNGTYNHADIAREANNLFNTDRYYNNLLDIYSK